MMILFLSLNRQQILFDIIVIQINRETQHLEASFFLIIHN